MAGTVERDLRQRLLEDPRGAWSAFIEEFTPTLLTIIEHAGLRSHDEAMEIYVRTCEHLAADDCARLRRHDPAKGPLAAWLTVVVRRVIVDWVRSRKGRRRVFQSIRDLGPEDRGVFELYYWRGYSPVEIAELTSTGRERPASLAEVFESLERIERALSERQRAELLSMAARVRQPASLEDDSGRSVDPPDERQDPEFEVRVQQTGELLAAALRELPAEDSLLVSMRYLDGLSQAQVERALQLPSLGPGRMGAILARLRSLLTQRGFDARDVAAGVLALQRERAK
jgi:DNA-directed RNA polymerase specialized sigma24 family protein